MICIIGASGNMGKRYQSVCKYLNIPFDGLDVNDPLPVNDPKYTHYVIATPTVSHEKILHYLCAVNSMPLKILCEKPILCDDPQSILKFAEERGHEIYMVNQYAYYSHQIHMKYDGAGRTSYNYYNSGGDGIFWDCIQLIYLAKNEISLSNNTPIWYAEINGVELDRETIDLCYVKMIHDFWEDGKVYGQRWDKHDIIAAHNKVMEYGKNTNWNPSALNIYQATRVE